MGHTVSKKALMESELQILKGLDFKLNVSNPLTYVEILLEVLGKSSKTKMSYIIVFFIFTRNQQPITDISSI